MKVITLCAYNIPITSNQIITDSNEHESKKMRREEGQELDMTKKIE